MTTIAFLDENFPFSNRQKAISPDKQIQAHTVSLAEAFAQRNLKVIVFGNVQMSIKTFGVDYQPLAEAPNGSYDLAIANNNPRLFSHIKSKKFVLWLHAPSPQPCLSLPFLFALFRYNPHLVFSSLTQKKRWRLLLPFFSHHVIQHGVHQDFLDVDPIKNPTPAPHALFIANAYYGLGDIIKLWSERIHPALPKARLDIFAEKSLDDRATPLAEEALALARNKAGDGINLCAPLPRRQLAKALCTYRLFLSYGHINDNNDTTALEAQVVGLPVVATNKGSAGEKIDNRVTGFVVDNPIDYADSVINLLKEDTLWLEHHKAALTQRNFNTWQFAATVWKQLFLNTP